MSQHAEYLTLLLIFCSKSSKEGNKQSDKSKAQMHQNLLVPLYSQLTEKEQRC